MTISKADLDEARSLAERLEFNSTNHFNWAWAVEHREAAKLIRRLAGLPPAKDTGRAAPTKAGVNWASFTQPKDTKRRKK